MCQTVVALVRRSNLPRVVVQQPTKGSVHAFCRLSMHRREGMSVYVESERDGSVAQPFLDDLGVHVLPQPHGRGRVTQVMEADIGDTLLYESLAEGIPVAVVEVAPANEPAIAVGEDVLVSGLALGERCLLALAQPAACVFQRIVNTRSHSL